MMRTPGVHWTLPGYGFSLATLAAVIVGLYGLIGESVIAVALGLEYVLIAATIFSARSIQKSRGAAFTNSALAEVARIGEVAEPQAKSLRSKVQVHAVVLGSLSAFVGLLALLQWMQLQPNTSAEMAGNVAFPMLCLGLAFIWSILARSFDAIRDVDLPEARPLMFAFREAQWGAMLAVAGIFGSSIHPMASFWTARILLGWVVIVSAELLVRLVGMVFVPSDATHPVVAPIDLLMREAIFTASNPIGSILRTFESRSGVSLRSTWAVQFLKRSALPLLVFLLLLSWGMTALTIVQTHEMAFRELWGRIDGEPLLPGLHASYPWPFGCIRAFPVKTVRELPIGFVEDDQGMQQDQPRALLWTKPHAKEEFALALGGGTELISVNAVVYFKISENAQSFRDYVYRQSEPEAALSAFAYRALMEETRGRTLDEVLSADRASFARRVVDSVRQQVQAARLGLEVVDLALLNLHPPIESGRTFLDVINARLDASRRVTEATGEQQVALLEAETQSVTAVATARVEGSRRVTNALSEAAEFRSIAQASSQSPQVFRQRLWIEALESALTDQRLFLVDHTLLDDGGELMLDTRRNALPIPPSSDGTTSKPLTGAKSNE